MEEMIIDTILNYAETMPYVLMVIVAIGTAYPLMIAIRPVVHLIVGMTKTQKDDKYARIVYDFLDKYGPSFRKIESFAKEKKKK